MTTPWITAGDCKAAATGLAGAVFTAWLGDADAAFSSGTLAALGTLSSFLRKKFGSLIDATAGAIAGLASVGIGTIIPGAHAGTINDTAVTTASVIIPFIIGVPDTTAGEIGAACLVNGVVTITSKANAALTLNVGYLAINK
jgi:hypothetical protein